MAKVPTSPPPLFDDIPLPVPSEAEQTVPAALRAEIEKQVARHSPVPIPSRKTRITRQVYEEHHKLWLHAQYIAEYQRCPFRNPAWDAAAEEFLREYVADSSPKNFDRLFALGEMAIELKCPDPLVLTLKARLRPYYWSVRDVRQALELYERAFPNFSKGTYSANTLLRMNVDFAKFCLVHRTDMRLGHRAGPHLDTAVQQVGDMLALPKEAAPIQRRFSLAMIDGLLTESLHHVRGKLLRSLQARPTTDGWVLRMLLAREEIRLAWLARGGGFANEVAPEAFAEFHARIARARVHLLEASKLEPENPEAPTEMIHVAMVDSDHSTGDERFWFDRAVQAQCDHEPAYQAMYRALQPRWGGSHEEVLAIGKEALATKQWDTELPLHYWAAMSAVINDLEGDVPAIRRMYESHCDDLLQMFAAMRDNLKDPARKRTAASAIVAVNLIAGRNEAARERFRALGDEIDVDVFRDFGITYSQVRRRLAPERDPPPRKAPRFSSSVHSLAFSPDGTVLYAATADGILHAVRIPELTEVFNLPENGSDIRRVLVSPDGELLATGGRQSVVALRSAKTGKVVRSLEHEYPIHAFAFYANGRQIVCAGGWAQSAGAWQVWDVANGAKLAGLRGHDDAIESVVFLADGTLLTTTAGFVSSGRIHAGDLRSWKTSPAGELKRMTPASVGAGEIVVSPDGGSLAVIGEDETPQPAISRQIVRTIDPRTGTVQAELPIPGHNENLAGAAFVQKGNLLATAGSRAICFWDPRSGTLNGETLLHGRDITAVAYNAKHERLATGDASGDVRLTNVADCAGQFRFEIPGDQYALLNVDQRDLDLHQDFDLEVSPDGATLLFRDERLGILLWDLRADMQRARLIRGVGGSPMPVSFSRDSRVLWSTLGQESRGIEATAARLRAWDASTGRKTVDASHVPAKGSFPAGFSVAASPDGRYVATGHLDGTIYVWNPKTLKPWKWGTLREHQHIVSGLSFSADSRTLASSSLDRTVKLWDLPENPESAEKELISSLTKSGLGPARKVWFTPDSQKLIISHGANTEIVNATTLARVLFVPGYKSALSLDGTRLVAGGGLLLPYSAQVWDVATGKLVGTLRGANANPVRAVAITPDGRYAFTASSNEPLRQWDVATGLDLSKD